MQEKQFYIIPGAILLGSLIIAGAILSVGNSLKPGSSKTRIPSLGSTPPDSSIVSISVTEKDHIRGSPSAPITIVEFSDLECPFCKRFHLTLKRVLQEYGDKVRWVYKHYPIDSLHPKADKEAEAAECAAELGGNDVFWKYVDRIFEITPSNNNLDLALLPQIAQEFGLDRAKFEDCLNSGKYAQKVEEQFQEGLKAGVTGTPGSFVNGQPVRGAVEYEILKSIIDDQLKNL